MITEAELSRAQNPVLQHIIETYASEINKTAVVFRQFNAEELAFRPHLKSATTEDIFRHQLLSERRFFGEFLGSPEPEAHDLFPEHRTAEAYAVRLEELARPRLAFLAGKRDDWWLEKRAFFDVERERIWIFWRRVLHSAHHRTQLTVYLRLLDKPVVSVYGPTADVTWKGADPTLA